ncbi:hypothetical protein [Desulforamulus reducens]|nr:hypothetical protein [Desulforamulus reducens]
MDKVMDYIQALTNLYGVVHKDKVQEIYNQQNDDKIDDKSMEYIIKEKKDYLINHRQITVHKDYFVYLSIMVAGSYFDEELRAKEGKPYYIPEKEELLKYKDVNYFEVNKEYEELLQFLKKMFWRKSKAEDVAREIQMHCESFRAMENLHLLFEEKKIRFKNAKQADELMRLIRNLANNTRIWQNNGYTPNELDVGKR